MSLNKVFLVSAGLLQPKKGNNFLNKQSLYPNYGLISLASVLKQKEYSPIIIHGDHKPPKDIIDLIIKYNFTDSSYPILLSLPSFFSISWAEIFCKIIHKKFTNKKVIVGGKWVTAGNEEWIKLKLDGVKHVISENAEDFIENILINKYEKSNISLLKPQNIPTHLDYTTVHNYKKYQPSIELSRGCGCGCSFCLEKNSPYQLLTSPKQTILSIIQHKKDYKDQDITPYFQTSFFKPSTEWCNQFHKYYKQYDLKTKWRTQTRIDSLSVEKIKLLAKSGLKILDLGLESASPTQILRMGKSNSPETYLKKASLLIKTCYEYGIWAKINILLYAGETHETIEETTKWLESHNKFIKGLSINPLFIYKYFGYKEFVISLKKFGASLVCENSLESHGYAHLNLSDTISFSEAKKISLNIRQTIVSEKDYFDLKTFSYFDSSYTFENFKKDLKSMNEATLPFH